MIKKYEERSLQMGEGCEDMHVPHTWSYNVTSVEDKFNNQGDRMTHSGYSEPLSPAISAIATWPMNTLVICDRDGGYVWA